MSTSGSQSCVVATLLISKLLVHIQGFIGHEDFHIMELEGCDVLLGMPWFRQVGALVAMT